MPAGRRLAAERLKARRRGGRPAPLAARYAPRMSPTWIWMQIGIVLFVLAGVVIAIVKLL